MSANMKWRLASIASIWVAVGLISGFAPDLINLADQQHVAFSPILSWIAGPIATKFVWDFYARGLRPTARGAPRRAEPAAALLFTGLWTAVAMISVFSPTVLTGTDATRFPLAAMLAIIGGTAATFLITRYFPRLNAAS
jgi:hypothetical protein